MSKLAREIEGVIFADCLDNIILLCHILLLFSLVSVYPLGKTSIYDQGIYTDFSKNVLITLNGKPNKVEKKMKRIMCSLVANIDLGQLSYFLKYILWDIFVKDSDTAFF